MSSTVYFLSSVPHKLRCSSWRCPRTQLSYSIQYLEAVHWPTAFWSIK